MADIPAGTGLGSSGSFTVGVLKALHSHVRRPVTNEELAALACHIEIDRLGEPVGKQDQYAAAIGGLTAFHFHADGTVSSSRWPCRRRPSCTLEENLLLFFTGVRRSASEEIAAQVDEAARPRRRSTTTSRRSASSATRAVDALEARRPRRASPSCSPSSGG